MRLKEGPKINWNARSARQEEFVTAKGILTSLNLHLALMATCVDPDLVQKRKLLVQQDIIAHL
jgi:hypothetical protein